MTGRRFDLKTLELKSAQELHNFITEFQHETGYKFSKGRSKTVQAASKDVKRKILRPEMKFYNIFYHCEKGKLPKNDDDNLKKPKKTEKTDCPAFIKFETNLMGYLYPQCYILSHNHDKFQGKAELFPTNPIYQVSQPGSSGTATQQNSVIQARRKPINESINELEHTNKQNSQMNRTNERSDQETKTDEKNKLNPVDYARLAEDSRADDDKGDESEEDFDINDGFDPTAEESFDEDSENERVVRKRFETSDEDEDLPNENFSDAVKENETDQEDEIQFIESNKDAKPQGEVSETEDDMGHAEDIKSNKNETSESEGQNFTDSSTNFCARKRKCRMRPSLAEKTTEPPAKKKRRQIISGQENQNKHFINKTHQEKQQFLLASLDKQYRVESKSRITLQTVNAIEIEQLPDVFVDKNIVDISIIKDFFSANAFKALLKKIEKKKTMKQVTCGVCYLQLHLVKGKTILCNGCVKQHHYKCVKINRKPRGRWFCGKCTSFSDRENVDSNR